MQSISFNHVASAISAGSHRKSLLLLFLTPEQSAFELEEDEKQLKYLSDYLMQSLILRSVTAEGIQQAGGNKEMEYERATNPQTRSIPNSMLTMSHGNLQGFQQG
ncbi:hypothetical protein AV530_005060 [Patagioenas fasciata monilis]|uniref:Uncharacterized protein n=1 Tax=Patagioenas fasciata monilis TaxID=372326 RepID=A0A1V4K420_PATFA|nr:hypothetical protein AV530_005060 [Patagioenas fasciata monilis]